MKKEIQKFIITENNESEFQMRIFKEDGVGLLTTKSEKHYLFLDSIEYWYDLIQDEYPKKKKCSCKNEWFNVNFNYLFRQETEDVKEINIVTKCIQCHKNTNLITINIDYSPTNKLINKPISLCNQPKLKYKSKELTSYWNGDDLKYFLQYIFNEMKLNVYCYYIDYNEKTTKFEKVNFKKADQIITVNHRYLNFYFSKKELELSKYIKLKDTESLYVKEGIWRKDEIVQLGQPFAVFGYGVIFYINYCNQFLERGNIKDKSKDFEDLTNDLNTWLTNNFVTKRGKNSFDGHIAYEKYITKKKSERNASS